MIAPIRVVLIGAAGRMGLEIARLLLEKNSNVKSNLKICFAIEHNASPFIGQDIGVLAHMDKAGIKVSSDLAAACKSSDVIIDLSLPTATTEILKIAVSTKTALVSGTTGLSKEILLNFDKAGKTIAVLHTPNLSLGVAVLNNLVNQAVTLLGSDYDVEIVEMHHRKKVDAPSGTALLLANTAAEASKINPVDSFNFGRHGKTGQRPTNEIGIHSVRGGGVFGDHTVILANANERIELSHKAETRVLFAQGAVQAALFLSNAKPGRYAMIDTL